MPFMDHVARFLCHKKVVLTVLCEIYPNIYVAALCRLYVGCFDTQNITQYAVKVGHGMHPF